MTYPLVEVVYNGYDNTFTIEGKTMRTFLLAVILCLSIAATVNAASTVTLAWDPNTDQVDGYKIFHRIEGGAYDYANPAWLGAETSGGVQNIADDVTHYFVVRAYRGALESADSVEVSFTPASYTPINGVTGVIIKTIVIPVQ